ncbi:MAG: 30S ribosomal protein S6 [Candidatus Andersenbacteria bacterium RIFCSPHIGHO2_01_FULL_46_36]|uniref:Small ribosomal subunit protein bS6 n=1 Tax=Candidatus Andersenbacteria bacterium RIFCSPHIGHO2_12_FULL_45_11 TaxID=1797281 RepID=A0A1G1X511_9BACT|nr:MAG: 30S ribosomal protein S6 [Candidatus Andersenbacteria bacterium RIFCSPHIGHO2_01_FULL_46_36]OGY35053.1 MAG: 30S ribosomal protein S6 [Candidatus Andersenbacteria bacterium RIFCSPHIGHO2_12_FULL_45_11]
MKQGQYEITYLIDSKLSEEARGALCAGFDEQVTAAAGTVVSSAPVLRKTLAYPVKKQSAAFLRVMQIEVDPAKIAELQSFLKKSEGVMRLTLLATPPRTRMSAELIEKHGKRKGKGIAGRPEKYQKESIPVSKEAPAKEVTMQDVEKGIEEALVTEVK